MDPNTHLPGDAFSGFNSPARGQNNIFEGLYLDDFVIGFAERGEAVSNAITSANSTFVNNPDGQRLVTEGEYQLEIRRGPDLSSPLVTSALSRSIDTNDRMATGRDGCRGPVERDQGPVLVAVEVEPQGDVGGGDRGAAADVPEADVGDCRDRLCGHSQAAARVVSGDVVRHEREARGKRPGAGAVAPMWKKVCS